MCAQWPDTGTGQHKINYQLQDLSMRQRQRLVQTFGIDQKIKLASRKVLLKMRAQTVVDQERKEFQI